MMPIGNMIAPANKKPHRPSLKQVKMWLNHAAAQINAVMIQPMGCSFIRQFRFELFRRKTRP